MFCVALGSYAYTPPPPSPWEKKNIFFYLYIYKKKYSFFLGHKWWCGDTIKVMCFLGEKYMSIGILVTPIR